MTVNVSAKEAILFVNDMVRTEATGVYDAFGMRDMKRRESVERLRKQ